MVLKFKVYFNLTNFCPDSSKGIDLYRSFRYSAICIRGAQFPLSFFLFESNYAQEKTIP